MSVPDRPETDVDAAATIAGSTKQRTHFPAFPYQPYSIQRDFMTAVYARLQAGGVGLFESPTGTGKTLSLICSALQWLEDRRADAAAAAAAAGAQPPQTNANGAASDDEPDWLREADAKHKAAIATAAEAARAARIAAAQAKAKAAQQRRSAHKAAAAREAAAGEGSGGGSAAGGGVDPDAEFLLDEWDEGGSAGAKRTAAILGGRQPGAVESSDSGSSSNAGGLAGGDCTEDTTSPLRQQVIFSSRTHSQLSQFVAELQRTPFALSLSMVALASRKTLCINEEVARLHSGPRINEKCLDLQQQRAKRRATRAGTPAGRGKQAAKAAGGCPYLGASARHQAAFRDGVLAVPSDVEELAAAGRRRGICPYYAARRAAPDADLLLVPYGSLLLKETREALGIRLQGAVIIIDEAHNLVDAVNGAHSAAVAVQTVQAALEQLTAYWARFSGQLAPGNARQLRALMAAATKLLAFLQPDARHGAAAAEAAEATDATVARSMSINDFLFAATLDNVNLFSLVRYTQESKVLFKVAGFADAQRRRQAPLGAAEEVVGDKMAALHGLVGFLSVLTNADADGRIIWDPAARSAKFVLLNAAAHFRKVTAAAHALILASGTLAPVSALTAQLFPRLPPAALGHFSCGHVVAQQRLLALALGVGPSGRALDFRASARRVPAALDELARLLQNVATVVPQGLVVFFPSFAYAEQAASHWRASGDWARLCARKRIFQEPRSASDVESMLAAYTQCVSGGEDGSGEESSGSTKGGAMLLAVVGGKMAEGINFGDGLGRCVVMVGMPFPNPTDPELRERMAFMDAAGAAASSTFTAAGPTSTDGSSGGGLAGLLRLGSGSAGQQYYQDLCMKAVNQCIGRCIRHRSDFAAILLADARYAAGGRTDPCRQLPGWVRASLVTARGYGDAHARLARFFRGMASAEAAAAADSVAAAAEAGRVADDVAGSTAGV